MTAPSVSPLSDHDPDSDFLRCRRMWADAVMAFYNDWWRQLSRAKGDPATIAAIRLDALLYWMSADGRLVADCAGITTDPQRLADVAIDPTASERTLSMDARCRTKRQERAS